MTTQHHWFQYDSINRVVTSGSEYNAAGTSVVYSKIANYDADSNTLTDSITTVQRRRLCARRHVPLWRWRGLGRHQCLSSMPMAPAMTVV
jgi:hypothetical protein